jgi:hypothetical protein
LYIGITVSTIPAIIIKIYRIKQETNDNNEISSSTLPLRQFVRRNSFDSILNQRLQSLPNPKQLRIIAHIILIVLILSTCFTIYLLSFISIGLWLKYNYNSNDLSQINPFYASLVISITGFNQNGLSVW